MSALSVIPRPPGTPGPEAALGMPPLRQEIAAVAARLIADGGLDFASAKRRALDEVLDGRSAPRGMLPDNTEIDRALAEHLDLFDPEHPARVARMRRVALDLMHHLSACTPYLTGSVWKGIVAEHAPIHLQLFHDDPKDVMHRLLDIGLEVDVDEMPHYREGTRVMVEALFITWRHEPVILSLYSHDDLRGALRGTPPERGDAADVERLLADTPNPA